MRQGLRLILKPGTFFNQLQWSPNHWFIIILFLVASAIETQLGHSSALFLWYANFLKLRLGIGLGASLWIVTVLQLLFLLIGAHVVTQAIWLLGSLMGQPSSSRVLFRRLAVVFTILLTAYTCQHLSAQFAYATLLAIALYAWGITLGFFAISEQFRLDRLATLVVVLFAGILITQGWQFSARILHATAIQQAEKLTQKPKVIETRIR